SSYSIHDVVDNRGNFFNFDPAHLDCSDPAAGAICAPPPQQVGNAPRFNSDLRGDTIRRLDFSVFKNFAFRENMKLQLRAEFFNFTNPPRFGFPNSSFGDPGFGTINSQINSPRQAQMGVRFLFLRVSSERENHLACDVMKAELWSVSYMSDFCEDWVRI